MKQSEKIIENNKVYFKPDGLEKPQNSLFQKNPELYIIKSEKYEASKRVIEVSNVIEKGHY